jgi:hypothetical protein
MYIQSGSEGKVIIVGDHSVGHCKKKNHMNFCRLLNGCPDGVFQSPNSVRFLFVALDKEPVLQRKVDTREELLPLFLDAIARM